MPSDLIPSSSSEVLEGTSEAQDDDRLTRRRSCARDAASSRRGGGGEGNLAEGCSSGPLDREVVEVLLLEAVDDEVHSEERVSGVELLDAAAVERMLSRAKSTGSAPGECARSRCRATEDR